MVGQNFHHFLCFPQRVAEDQRVFIPFACRFDEGAKLLFQQLALREAKVRRAKGAFHDQNIALSRLQFLGGCAFAEFKIAAVQKRAGFVLHINLRRPQDVTGWQKRDLIRADPKWRRM